MRTSIWNRQSVRNQVFAVMLAVSLLAIFSVVQLTSLLTQSSIRSFTLQYLSLHQEKAQSGFEFLIGEVNMLSVRLLTRQDIYDTIRNGSLNVAEKEAKLRKIVDEMNINRGLVGPIAIASTDGSLYRYGDDPGLEEPGQRFLDRVAAASAPVWSDVRRGGDGEAYVMVGRKYRNLFTGQRLGLLIVYVKESALYDVFKNMVLPEWNNSLLLSEDRYILAAGDPSRVGTTVYDEGLFSVRPGTYKTTKIDGNPTIVAKFRLSGDVSRNGLDWSIVSLLPQKQLFEKLKTIRQYSYLLQAFLVLASFAISWYVARNITNPVNALARDIRKFGSGDRPVRKPKPTGAERNELFLLEGSFNEMILRIDDLIANINESKDRQRETELIALQAQINPHFLYNTLDAIGWLAKLNDQREIGKMIVELARFYRLSLHKGDKYILVEEELGIVESYVELEKMRFPNKFAITYEIAEDIRSCLMLKIVLQPFVENAFKHGIANKRGPGMVKVAGFADGDDLVFEIGDDGPGFDTTGLKPSGQSNDYVGGGYGILNVDERIRLEYGEGYGIDIRSEPGLGTVVRIRIKRLTRTN